MDSRPSIRLATVSDAASIAAVYAPYCETTAISFETNAPTPADMANRITTVLRERPWLVLEEGADIVGYAYASPHHERAAYQWSVSTAVYINKAHHRRGAGRALYTTLFELLRHLGYFRATAGVTLPNAASVGLHEAVGFSLVGVYRHIGYKLGKWHDVAWFQADVQPLAASPPPPRPISTLAGTREWDAATSRGLAHYIHRT